MGTITTTHGSLHGDILPATSDSTMAKDSCMRKMKTMEKGMMMAIFVLIVSITLALVLGILMRVIGE